MIDQCQYLSESLYQSLFPERIYSGNKYSIKVEVPGFEPVVVNSISIPESPPEVKEFQLTPYKDQPPRYTIENLVTYSVLNKRDYTVYNMKVTYDDSPLAVLGYYLFSEANVVCEDFDKIFSNKCYSEEWIDRKYHFTWHYEIYENSAGGYRYPIPQEWIYFHIGIIDPAIIEYDAAKDGGYGVESGYTEPALSKGNVEGGLGYVVGENKVTNPYKVP